MGTDLLPGAGKLAELERLLPRATTVAAVAEACLAARDLAREMERERCGAAVIMRMLSLFNDEALRAVLRLVGGRHVLPPAEWCWLGFGSEGRMEQTLATDQDNGIVFAATDDGEARALRERFVPFAAEVNRALADCGFPLCDGEVMASNPKWCLSLSEWCECFDRWIRTPEPEALLNATIFFDFRALAGQARLAAAMRDHLAEAVRGRDIFLRMMAENALLASPPLGHLRDFSVGSGGKGEIDIKKFGSRLFVDAARILALATGVGAPSTIERLRASARGGALRGDEAEASVGAFCALQEIRIRAQVESPAGSANRVAPAALNPFDRRVLLEALRNARALQRMLKIRFQMHH